MQHMLVGFGRTAACILLLFSLAACGGGGSDASGSSGSSSSTPPADNTTPTQPATSSITLSWNAPTQNTDGSTLMNLSGYKIHYGTRPGEYTETVTITNPSLTRYVIDNLATGTTYYLALTSISSNGTESELSGEVSKTI